MVRSVLDRSSVLPRKDADVGVYQEILEPIFEVLAQGSVADLTQLEQVSALFEEGDLGELRLFLRGTLDDSDRSDVEEAMRELEMQLQEQGALPWPGRDRIAILDWPNRTVRLLFLQGFPALIAVALVLVNLATIAVGIAALINGLRSLGVPIPDAITNVADAVLVIAAIATGIIFLRGLGLPLTVLIPGGLLIFALLEPDAAFAALKWVRDTLAPALGINLPFLIVGGLVAAAGAFSITRGGTPFIVAGAAGLGAGGFLVFRAFARDEGVPEVPELEPEPDGSILQVVGEPGFAINQV